MAKRNLVVRFFCGFGRAAQFYFDSFHRAFLKAWLSALAVSGAIGLVIPSAIYLLGITLTTDQEAIINHLYIQIPTLIFLSFSLIMLFYVPFSKYENLQQEVAGLKARGEHNLVFEIDLRNTIIQVEQTNSALRVFATVQLRFENKDIHPLSMKDLDITLHRGGTDISGRRGILGITSKGIPVGKEDFFGMAIAGRQVTDFYQLKAMVAIEDNEHIKSAEDIDLTDFLRVSMQSSGDQPTLSANLRPIWEAARREGGTSLITVTGAPSIPKDYLRLT